MSFNDDNIHESEVMNELDRAGLRYKDGYHYILSQCPLHEDKNPSVQIFKQDWWVNCMAGCGRFHITKAFPGLRPHSQHASQDGKWENTPTLRMNASDGLRTPRKEKEVKKEYKKMDLMEYWKGLKPLPPETMFKTMDATQLNYLGWRQEEGGLGVGTGWFIPYFDSNKATIPFAQVRHHVGDIRFHFAKDLEPRVYGTWNIDPSNSPLFIVEGTSDGMVLDYCGIPWIALPSSASGALLKKMALHCHSIGVKLVYAGDNDEAGEKLREALDETNVPYRVKQPPTKYKDWGDYLVAEGAEAINKWVEKELVNYMPVHREPTDQEAGVLGLMGGGQLLEK